MNLLLKKPNNFLMQDKINTKRSEHKKKLKEVESQIGKTTQG